MKTLRLALALAAGAVGARAGELNAETLPVNRWVKVPSGKKETGFDYSIPIFVPGRGRLLQWGGTLRHYRTGATPRNDVRAFDSARGEWLSDYPRDPDCPYPPGGHGAAPRGCSYYGLGEIMKSGSPWPSVAIGGCYDSRRKRLVYTMAGLMAAYDPEKRTWSRMDVRTVIDGEETTGGPRVYGLNTCYDPVNDEIVMFPHWKAFNAELREATGEVSGHYGTLVFSYRDMTWRRASGTFGSEEVRKGRKAVIGLTGKLSAALDELYVARRKPLKKPRAAKDIAALVEQVPKAELPQKARPALVRAAALLKPAARKAASREFSGAIARGAEALRALRGMLETPPLQVEPPPRCAAPMVYDPENKAIVMFGGRNGLVRADVRPSGHLGSPPGELNDTWVYDCQAREWREIAAKRRPPRMTLAPMVYGPKEKLVLLAHFSAEGRKGPRRSTFYTLDVAAGEWTRRGSVPWPGSVTYQRAYASRTPTFNMGLDEKRGLLVYTQNVLATADGKKFSLGETYVMRLDVARLPSEPAPVFNPDPPIVPQTIPPDDPGWVAKLKALPANTWTPAGPPGEATRRDWGNAACDPVRGHVYYFGGGHSTYQVNDVAIYAVGANKWSLAAGDHNDYVPPVNWGGCYMGFCGGRHAHHQRNQYAALDGRMYVSTGGWAKINRGETIPRGRRGGERWAWFYDADRGGVWRRQKIDEKDIRKGEKVDGVWSAVHVVDPAGRVFGIVGDRSQYYGKNYPNMYVSVYDIYAGRLEVRSVPGPFPWRVPECRPFCYAADRDQVFYYEFNQRNKRQVTWVYDVKTNTFKDLRPRRQPPGLANTVEYLDGQDAVYAIIDRKAEWVYSFRHNTWAPLATSGAKPRFTGPYGQIVYAARYGVLVYPRPRTAVMRPDVSGIDWGN